MYSHEQLIEFHNEVRVIKEHMWYEHKEPDLYPILVVRWRDMEMQSLDVAGAGAVIERVRAWAIKQHPDSWVSQAEMGTPLVIFCCLAALQDGVQMPGVEQMPAPGAPMESIWLACEGYGLEGKDEDIPLEGIKHGDLKRDYMTNPESKVLERLTTYQVETSSTGLAEWGRVTSSFHKDDGGLIVWHDHHVDTSETADETLMEGSYDKLLDIMMPHVTREKLA